MDNDVIQVITGGFVIIIGIAAVWALTVVISWWKVKKEALAKSIETDEKIKRYPYLQTLLKHVLDTVDNVVKALNETMKKEILEATEDGKLTDEEKKRLRDKAVSLVKMEIPEMVWNDVKEIIGDMTGDVTEYLKTAVENSVEDQKWGILVSEEDEIYEDLGEVIEEEDDQGADA